MTTVDDQAVKVPPKRHPRTKHSRLCVDDEGRLVCVCGLDDRQRSS